MYLVRLLILTLFFSACSSSSQKGIRIGIDPLWYPQDFGPQTAYVNGYTEDLLLEMSRYSGLRFELVRANWDTLLEGLRSGKYDAVITALPPYESTRAKYDFSENFLSLGSVLIIPKGGYKRDLSALKGDMVGIIANDPAELIIARHPTLILRTYSSIPDLLNAVAKGEIQGALLNQIPAANFVSDLYATSLEIVGEPLTDEGIHLIGLKGGIKSFEKNLELLRKKKRINALQKKWNLN
jgi:polar amino acid transport system substrate-binding protein